MEANSIVIELFERAAPGAVRRLVDLAAGPVFNEALVGPDDSGYFDALTFNYTKPHLEIRTSERPPTGLLKIKTEIDAGALGLDEDRIADVGAAMDVMQHELLKGGQKAKQGKSITPQLQAWIKQWYENYSAEFLVGVSRKEINEALGYEYSETPLESVPVTKGTVVLVPKSPVAASPRLSIVLSDMPLKTGQWMVVGRVVEGLEIADQISLEPLILPRRIKQKSYRPLNPVVIHSAEFLCD
jgi:cyclophilin family peptidyl-prolyl cis-trans isomerase